MTALSDLQGYQATIDSGWTFVAAPLLTSAIDSALGVPAPDGSPAVISAQASAYHKASATFKQVADNLKDVAGDKLPAAWRGGVAETASEAVRVLSEEATATAAVLSQAATALQAWADNLTTAQRNDWSGRGSLKSAKSDLGPLGGWLSTFVELANPESFAVAVAEARAGIASMVSAATLAQNSGEDTAATLNALGGQARASRVAASGLDALDELVLATEQNAAHDGGGSILTAAELARASQIMSEWSQHHRNDLNAFEALLAGAKSPAEAAYLMKALAAGNSLASIKRFHNAIHPYGSNLDWLSQHLAPDLVQGTYQGQSGVTLTMKGVKGSLYMPMYSQGIVLEDCVAASTVVALANLDPVYMLQLTTDDHPGVPPGTPMALYHSLQSAYTSNYQKAEIADGVKNVTEFTNAGVETPGENMLTNGLVGKATGTAYGYVPLNGSGDNQAMLPQVEQAVASGQPVPIDVRPVGAGIGHQMVIIGSSGNNLQIYEPESGRASWVTTQQFVNNQLGGVSGGLPIATALELPSP